MVYIKLENTCLVPVNAEKQANERYRISNVKDGEINETDIFG